MQLNVTRLLITVTVPGLFIIANFVPLHSCWYVPLRGNAQGTIDRFETALREGKIDLYGFPFVYMWRG